MKFIFLTVLALMLLFSTGNAANNRFIILGPNLEYRAKTVLSPLDFRGAWMPQANTGLNFTWFEPLSATPYGEQTGKSSFLRFFMGSELSPFYGTVKLGIGGAPLPPPFNIFEVHFFYTNENLFYSNVEQALKKDDEPSINKTWNSNYILGKLYRDSRYSLIQSFEWLYILSYSTSKFSIDFSFLHTFIDIAFDYDKKSYDYMRSIPLFSRDYLFSENFVFNYSLNKNLEWNVDLYGTTSERGKLFYMTALTGPVLFFENSLISLSAGWYLHGSLRGSMFETKSDHFSSKSDIGNFLISLQYKRFWNFLLADK